MRHRIKGKILSLTKNKRKALIKSLIHSLLHFKRIKTTKAKAKETKKVFDKLMARAQNQTLTTIRYLRKMLNKEDVFRMLAIAKTYKNIKGGYTRIVNLKPRARDNAKMVLMEIINYNQEENQKEKNNSHHKQKQKIKPLIKK